MVLVVLTVAGAIVAGWISGGRLRHLSSMSFRGAAIAAVAAIAQFVHAFAPSAAAGRALTGVSQAAVLWFLWLNRLVAGAVLVALGSTLNAVVIVANGAMPVSREALLAVSRHPAEMTAGGRHRLLAEGDALPWLADVIGLPLLRTVVSVGDIVLAAGIGLMVIGLMRQPRRRHAAID